MFGALALVLTACSNDTTNLPIKTIEWDELENGFYQFYTNDPAKNNYTFWMIDNGVYTSTVEIECKKISGAYNYGYGIIFGANDGHNFYYVMIDNSGYYMVNKQKDEKWGKPVIQDWTSSSGKLVTGYKKTNTIKVIREGSKYTIYFNNKEAFDFTNSDISGGDKADEKFPNTPRCTVQDNKIEESRA